MYEYHTRVKWKKDRLCALETGKGLSTDFSSPPEFKGIGGLLTPECLFVASQNTCFLMTFISMAERMRLEFLSYECEAFGYLEKTQSGFAFTRIVLRPRIEVKDNRDAERARKAIELADSNCLIANSIKSEIQIEPDIFQSKE